MGANKQSLTQLAVALAVLLAVVYVQFLRGPAASHAVPAATPQAAPAQATPQAAGPKAAATSQPTTAGEPAATADATLRRYLLERVRAIEAPVMDRNIFNFGRPQQRPDAGLTAEEERRAQAKLEAAIRKPKPEPRRPAPRPAAPAVRPPDWKYYGLATATNSEARQAFLLDGEDILLASTGALLRGRYRITGIGLQSIELEDMHAQQQFSIPLEIPQ